MLTDIQRKLWAAYEAAESSALRADKLRALGVFLDALEMSPPADWFPWARALAEQVVDHGKDFVIRRPLFDRAIFPALLDGYQVRLPGSARWLAGLHYHLLRNPDGREQLPPQHATELGLLWVAIEHDTGDRRARLRLIDKISDRLRNSLHELPSGVLYDMNGASAEQCHELEEELAQFCRLVVQEGMHERFAGLIRDCRFHFREYRNYLQSRDKYGSYAEFLSQHSDESTD